MVRIVLFRLMSTNRMHGKAKLRQPVQCAGMGTIVVDANVTVGYFPSPMFLSGYVYLDARSPSAEIRIGTGTSINNNFTAIAVSGRILIGARCLIGSSVEIVDSDFHRLSVRERIAGQPVESHSVSIGDDVFIGSNVRIMKGVSIGNGAVIANGAMVVNDVPACSVVAGVPAKVIRTIAA